MDPADIYHDTPDPFTPFASNEVDWPFIESLINRLSSSTQSISNYYFNKEKASFHAEFKNLNNLAKHLYSVLYESSFGKLKLVQIAHQIQKTTHAIEKKIKNKEMIPNLDNELQLIRDKILTLANAES